MADLIQFKKGNKANLPNLRLGEPGVALDEGRLYIGGIDGNIKIPNYAELQDVSAQLAENANKIGILNRKTDWVDVRDFGAKGDGVTDDTQAFKDAIAYAEANKKIIFVPTGQYLITQTLKIDIEKTTLIGNGGNTEIQVQPVAKGFTGTTVIQVYSGIGDWANRRYRMKTFGGFTIIDLERTKTLTALSMSGTKGTADEGHVEAVYYKEIFLDGFNIAIEYGEHVYKTISERIYTKDCNYAIKSISGQTDAGEVPVWRGCFFVDNSCRMELLKDAYFEHCSFHPNSAGVTHAIKILNNATMTISNCHFEHISNEDGSIYKDPWFYVENGAVLNIRDCFGVVSGTSMKSYFKKCVIENNGHVYIDSPLLSNLILRCVFDENTLSSTTGKRGSFVLNGTTGHSRVIKCARNINTSSDSMPLIDNKTLISDYTFSAMTDAQAQSIFVLKKENAASKSDNYTSPATVTKTIVTDPTGLSKYGNKVLRINSVQESGSTSYYIGVDLEIPNHADMVSLLTRCWKVGGTYIQANQSYMFFDEFGIRIPDNDVVSYNDGISLFTSKSVDNDVLELTGYRTYRKIPKNAKYVFVGIQVVQNGNTTADFYFDYFLPQFI